MDTPMMTLAELRKVEGGAHPTSAEAQTLAKAGYGKVVPEEVGDFRLVELKVDEGVAFYLDSEGTMVVAIAGTRRGEAIPEWWRVPFNVVENGVRYKGAEKALIEAKQSFPEVKEWFGVGHSLAGAIIDILISKGLLTGGHTFNPAIETRNLSDASTQQRVKREFQSEDILGRLARPFVGQNARYKPGGWANRIAQMFLPGMRIWDALRAHDIDNFAGGVGGLGGLPAGMAGGIRPFLCRVGSKAKFAKLLDFIAPPHKIYVEPFVGSGAFYWHKEPVEKEVLNDLDKNVAKTLRLIKKAPTDINKYPNLTSKESAKRFYLAKPRGTANELVWQLVSHCGGWMGQPVNANTGTIQRENLGSAVASKLSHIAEYKERMKHTSVTSQDYAVLLRKYGGSKDSFIFMDPPYEDSDNLGYAEELGFDFDRFATEVKKLKANWLITINDSKRIRELFKSFHIQPVLIKGHKSKFKTKAMGAIANTIGSNDRRELLISNFPLPSGWRAHKGSRVG